MIKIHQGDCLAVLKTLDADSVDCVVTSPPYWGLRDYGTAQWEGGDAECDHKQPGTRAGVASTLRSDGRDHVGPYEGERNLTVGFPYRHLCGKCGACRVDVQLGLEPTPEAYVARVVEIFREVWRVLRDDGTLWLNLGDSYASHPAGNTKSRSERGNGKGLFRQGGDAQDHYFGNGMKLPKSEDLPGLKPKDLVGIPWRVAFALQADGWYLRSDIIWHKPNPMPESVTDRPTKSHEYLFLLSKGPRYYWDAEAVREPALNAGGNGRGALGKQRRIGDARRDPATRTDCPATEWFGTARNLRSVWTIATEPAIDVYADGMHRITSPDCPVHGCPASPAPVQRCDEQQAASPSGRKPHTDSGPSSGQGPSVSSIPGCRCASLSGGLSAKPRSTKARRMVAESEPDETSADTPASRIECTEPRSRSAATYDRTPESNTSAGVSSDETRKDPSEQTVSGIADKSALATPLRCTCDYIDDRPKNQDLLSVFPSVWSIPTKSFKGAHFATYPPKLVEPCIKAGTSERGVCPQCRAPWVREVERNGYPDPEPQGEDQGRMKASGDIATDTQRRKVLSGARHAAFKAANPDRFIGWCPSCSHGLDPVPAVVLDPFAGSGTTGQVALQLGRSFIGIDLSLEYLDLAYDRIDAARLPLFDEPVAVVAS